MKNPQNITIALLVLSATILTGMLVGLHLYDTPSAEAFTGVRHQQASIIMTSGSVSGSYSVVYVIDVRTRRLNAYASDINTGSVRAMDTIDLDLAFRTMPR